MSFLTEGLFSLHFEPCIKAGVLFKRYYRLSVWLSNDNGLSLFLILLTYKQFTNEPPVLLSGNGSVYSRTRRDHQSGCWKHRWHPQWVLTLFIVCLKEAVSSVFQSDSCCTCVVNVGVSYLMVLCHCSRWNEIKPHVSLHRQCRGGSSQLLCRLVSVPDVCC